MTKETLPPDVNNNDNHEQFNDHLMPLRDRIVKIETIINYHDKEFQSVRDSIGDLTRTVEIHQDQILIKLDQQNKNYMDVIYEQYREHTESSAKIAKEIETNKNTFENYVTKWRAVQWAVWFTICVTLTTVGWGLSAAIELGFFNVNKINAAQEIQKRL